MFKYNKIDTIYKRDTKGSKKLIENDYINETVEFLKDNKWLCTEKIDGTNIGIVWDGHCVSYQGRTENAQIPDHLMNYLINKFGTNEDEELFEQKFGENNVILFGEGYGPKIQKCGSSYRSDVSFILFDVYLPDKNLYLQRKDIEDIAKSFNIDIVPVIMTGTIDEAVTYVKSNPKSTIGTANMEGLVCKPLVEMKNRMGDRVIVKIKVKDFK